MAHFLKKTSFYLKSTSLEVVVVQLTKLPSHKIFCVLSNVA